MAERRSALVRLPAGRPTGLRPLTVHTHLRAFRAGPKPPIPPFPPRPASPCETGPPDAPRLGHCKPPGAARRRAMVTQGTSGCAPEWGRGFAALFQGGPVRNAVTWRKSGHMGTRAGAAGSHHGEGRAPSREPAVQGDVLVRHATRIGEAAAGAPRLNPTASAVGAASVGKLHGQMPCHTALELLHVHAHRAVQRSCTGHSAATLSQDIRWNAGSSAGSTKVRTPTRPSRVMTTSEENPRFMAVNLSRTAAGSTLGARGWLIGDRDGAGGQIQERALPPRCRLA
jgi:hypothetical protein